MGLEERNGIAGLETVEGAEEFAAAAWVIADEGFGVEAGVRDVAAAAAGDGDFGKEVSGGLEDSDGGACTGFSTGDGCEDASCAAPCDDDTGSAHGCGRLGVLRTLRRCTGAR